MHLLHSLLALGLFTSSSIASPHPPPPPPPVYTATQIFRFPPSNAIIENLYILPDNRIVLAVWGVDGPTSPLYVLDQTTGTASIVASLPNSTAQTGITALGNNKYVITTGIIGENYDFINNTAAAHVFSLLPGSNTATILDTIPIPDTINVNGLVALPVPGNGERNILLSANSRAGTVRKINVATRTVSPAFTDPLFGGNTNITTSIGRTGVNGLSLKDGGKDGYVYFTNSAQGSYGRVKVNAAGNKVGPVQILSGIPTAPGQENFYDDLAVNNKGDAFLCWSADKLVRVDAKTKAQSIVLGPGVGSVTLQHPTAAKVGLSGDRELYVVTAGVDMSIPALIGGQVIKITW